MAKNQTFVNGAHPYESKPTRAVSLRHESVRQPRDSDKYKVNISSTGHEIRPWMRSWSRIGECS